MKHEKIFFFCKHDLINFNNQLLIKSCSSCPLSHLNNVYHCVIAAATKKSIFPPTVSFSVTLTFNQHLPDLTRNDYADCRRVHVVTGHTSRVYTQ